MLCYAILYYTILYCTILYYTSDWSGTLNLQECTKHLKLDVFALFSSVAAMLGNVGQANYSAVNSFMDSFAAQRRANDLAGVSLQWGLHMYMLCILLQYQGILLVHLLLFIIHYLSQHA